MTIPNQIPSRQEGGTLPRLLTAKEAAAVLRISVPEMSRLVRTCTFPPEGVVRPTTGRGRVLIREAVLARYIDQRTERPLSIVTGERRRA